MQTESVSWSMTQLPHKGYKPDIYKNIMNLMQFLPDNRQNTQKKMNGARLSAVSLSETINKLIKLIQQWRRLQ